MSLTAAAGLHEREVARIRIPQLTDLPPSSARSGRSAGGGRCGTLGFPGAAGAGPTAHAGACRKRGPCLGEAAGLRTRSRGRPRGARWPGARGTHLPTHLSQQQHPERRAAPGPHGPAALYRLLALRS